MKMFIIFLGLLMTISSCKKQSNNEFDTKILNDYFVTSIAFDNKGVAWIGTYDKGLIKYESGKTEIFNSQNSDISGRINDIKIDSKGIIWIGCNSLIKFDGSKFTGYNSTNSPIPEDWIRSIAIDNEDNIWFTSCRDRQGGIVKYDGINWTVYTPDNSVMPVNFVQSIAVDNENNIWLALHEKVCNPYLIKISGNDWKVYDKNDFGFAPVWFSNISVNSKNEVYCGIDYSLSSTGSNHLELLKFGNDKFEKVVVDGSFGLTSIKIDSSDDIWCAFSSGYYGVLDGTNFRFNKNMKTEGVFTFQQANDGKMWIGAGDGIYIINPK